ncbi:ParA family protein [Variovorax sp. ZS18.2.2]|uniref:ParA family protein n=1 Tax=Variovorax sp. ZS18.2.2 TaxID=2971255 RepID=UPI002150B563|nr:ParA family protein [Variovorax sp. ZS18.2.2]MCR6480969.1 ParA family protein [Variovorax sp. ZS18.2.2]
MLTLTVVATKGGVGKTTLAANIGGLLRDLGFRVLLVDADVQPALTRYFKLASQAPCGITHMVMSNNLDADCISAVELPPEDFTREPGRYPPLGQLDIVCSDTSDGKLQDWLSNRLDRLVRLRMSIKTPAVAARYDFVIIDTQGAIGHLQDTAVNAADLLIAPASPDVISAREFIAGTVALLERIESSTNMGFTVPAMKAIINRAEKTVDSRSMAFLIRDQFLTMQGRVTVLDTMVNSAVAFRKAATSRVPVHWIDPQRAGVVMHQLLWELIPSLRGRRAPTMQGVEIPIGVPSELAAVATASESVSERPQHAHS